MFRLLSIGIILAVLFSAGACQDQGGGSSVDLNPVETFAPEDAPESYTVDLFSVTGPWGYKKPDNAARRYPLMVIGYWGEGSGTYAAVEQRYPAFVLMYQKNTDADGAALAAWIDSAISAGYRIDTDRVYLTGFSMGGSGSYPLARGMYSAGKYFAGIIRVAGQSQADLSDAIAAQTAVWYHIGLLDDAARVTVARDALEYMRGHACNAGARETSVTDTHTGFTRTTITLSRGGTAMFNYSEYEGMGHDPSAAYRDPALFPWLFSQTLGNR